MAIKFENTVEARKAANTRTEDATSFEGLSKPVHPLGSRVTTKQVDVIVKAITKGQLTTLHTDKPALAAYAETGDASQLSGEQSDALKAVVKAAREASESDSQARRIWPRKVSAIVLNLSA